jgi:ElaB/YqjD/DUF883 family membrane-anchored ribosome-binding protein
MDQQALLIIMAVFVAVAAIALVIQAGMLFGIYKSSRAMQDNVSRLLPKIEALTETSTTAVAEARTRLAEVSTRTNDLLEITRRQLERVDDIMQDATTRARVQFDRAELVVDDAMQRTQETVALVHAGIMRPIREMNGVIKGLRAAMQFLARAGRPNPDEVTVDEEMFI